MRYIKVVELFGGIGSQTKGFENIFNNEELLAKNNINKEKINYKIVGTCEWKIDAIIGYDFIHHGVQETFSEFKDLDLENPLKMKKMFRHIKKHVLSKNGSDPYPFEMILKLKPEKVKQLYIALKRNKSLGSITQINPDKLPKADCITYSFPCQSVSKIGKNEGIKEGTKSGLLFEVKRILEGLKPSRRPKFLLMENVENLLSDEHFEVWDEFATFLEELGYKNTMLKMNAQEYGVPQHRKRIMCISELNGKLNIQVQKSSHCPTLQEYINLDDDRYREEYKACIPNNTPIRIKYINENPILNEKSYCMTISQKQDRHPNAGVILVDTEGHLMDNPERDWHINKEKSCFRLLTSREQIRLMGFSNEDFELLKKANLSDSSIESCAGNSIVVNKLEAIFIEMIKILK